ncbi:hypothetical protein CAP35_00930 [Chitinophagaceae bacterium IBVUCB1]|nr:hypothetical protein CAP35_00930 [Chitinophagaceae bacterium IBVUCB1]
MLRILLIFLCFPLLLQAQAAKDHEIWREKDLYVHALKLITENKGKVNDTCRNLLPANTKDIYIIKAAHIASLPDTLNGYRIHYIDADSNIKLLYHLQKEKNVPIFYLGKWHNFTELYQFWLMPVQMKKKKVWYAPEAFKFHYYFRHDLSRFEFTRSECVSW